jgi:Cdc6-like AAA superfamily ATPase
MGTTKTYAENYAVLKRIADQFREGGPEDIDSLVESFKEARAAYTACRERLITIKDEIDAEIRASS